MTTPDAPRIATKAQVHNIQVSRAVLDAARKDGAELLQSLRTTPQGLTQAETEERARTVGPNELAQEKKQGWAVRLLKMIRNPQVILLATLSGISFATGDARAGTVMAAMVVLSVGLRFVQEARADTAAANLKAMIHVTATAVRDGSAKEMPLRDLSRASWPLTATTLSVVAFGMWLPYSPLASALGLAQLPRMYWPILVLTLVGYMSLTQVAKVWLLRKKWI